MSLSSNSIQTSVAVSDQTRSTCTSWSSWCTTAPAGASVGRGAGTFEQVARRARRRRRLPAPSACAGVLHPRTDGHGLLRNPRGACNALAYC